MDFFVFPAPNGNLAIKHENAALSVVTKEGFKHVKTFKQSFKIMPLNLIFIRGLFYFIFGIYSLLKGTFECLGMESEKSKKKGKENKKAAVFVLIFVVLLAVVGSAFILGVLPAKIALALAPTLANLHVRGLIIASFKTLMFLGLLLLARILPSVREFFRFNGAANRLIGNLKGRLSHHSALGLLNFIVFSFILGFYVISLIAFNLHFLINPLLNILVFAVVVMLAFEMLSLISKTKTWAGNLCIVTSFFVSIKPRLTQEETAESALSEVKLIDKQKERKQIDTKQDGRVPFTALYTEVKNKLAKAGITDLSDADWIIATVLNKGRAEIKLVESVSAREYKEISRVLARRVKGEPLTSIFGVANFYGLDFNINKSVLTPRTDTEILAEEAIKIISKIKKPKVLDLGTGSGALAVVIAKQTNAKVYATDISKPALEVAKANAIKHGASVEFILSDLFTGLKKHKKYDIIVSNPPYITEKEMTRLPIEVSGYDPKLALYGGTDGLDFYRSISAGAISRLEKGGYLLYEIGKDGAKSVSAILKENRFKEIRVVKDYAKKDRVIVAKRGD